MFKKKPVASILLLSTVILGNASSTQEDIDFDIQNQVIQTIGRYNLETQLAKAKTELFSQKLKQEQVSSQLKSASTTIDPFKKEEKNLYSVQKIYGLDGNMVALVEFHDRIVPVKEGDIIGSVKIKKIQPGYVVLSVGNAEEEKIIYLERQSKPGNQL
ncbi:type IV pilus biogenesis protein PilP [Fastidiosibacter lacustris]|uniref:type IV pilus biogenesis protein PilP n=1 Tax=Fastidiosibacter lacustris TaxID=2056695 RepID=UPI000E34AF30|nr:type IV pilus biogenesis protein PilP [Fastidiosibacter lacustris]